MKQSNTHCTERADTPYLGRLVVLFGPRVCECRLHLCEAVDSATIVWSSLGLFVTVCLFVGIKPEHLYFAPCVWREVITPGNDRTRNQHFYVRETKTAVQTTYLSINGQHSTS